MPLIAIPERPNFDPGYEIPADRPDTPDWSDVEQRLAASRDYWVCTTRANGAPHAAPVWGLWEDGVLWFGSEQGSVKARNIARDPRVSVHLESGDEVVILEGTVEGFAAADVPPSTVAAFWAKYEMEPPELQGARWLRLTPTRAFTWEERAFQRTAARWRFEK